MPTLLIQSDGAVRGAVLRRRVLIGRKPINAVQMDHHDISRIHAWIAECEEGYYVADASSRTGTRVNGEKIKDKQPLRDGDEITIGPLVMTYHHDSELPPDCQVVEIADSGANPATRNDGILFNCNCGAPLWVPAYKAGSIGRCVHCAKPMAIPAIAPAQTAATPTDTCSVCQCPIHTTDEQTVCPSCGLTFHAECWQENRGCSAYGCAQVGVLDPKSEESSVEGDQTAEESHASVETPAAPFPWEFVLLGASVLGSIIGAVTFGIPAFLVGIAAILRASRSRGQPHGKVAILSAMICIVGIPAGVATSMIWWFNTSPLAWVRR